MYRNAFRVYLAALKNGAVTACGLMGEFSRGQRRRRGAELNALKCPELGQALYAWFIDCVQVLRCRVMAGMLIDYARGLKVRLLSFGYEPTRLPKLVGQSGKSWFLRWRRLFKVRYRKTVKHLKVSWSKVKQRVRVFLKNVFVLKFIWEKCFPGKEMRWISWDQKPAWFNNTALGGCFSPAGYIPTVREIIHQARQRFTICTCVDSASTLTDAPVPHVGVLFKAAPGGTVEKALLADPTLPPWMHIQCQEAGSYRSSDMCVLLRKTLPEFIKDEDSAVVCLDWYAGHRTEEIADLIAKRGHVLVMHGGGTTGYEQVNDTHLHALMEHMLKALEVAVFYGQLVDNKDCGVQKAASHSRQELVDMVRTIWLELNHAKISKRGYEQTGPKLPLVGPIYAKDIGSDLLPVFQALCPHDDPEQVGTQIRDEARN